MKLPSPESPELNKARDLIARLCEGRITASEASALEALVREHAEVRKLYILTMSTNADLHMQAALLLPTLTQLEVSQLPRGEVSSLADNNIYEAMRIVDASRLAGRLRIGWWLSAAAVFLCVLLFASHSFFRPQNPTVAQAPTTQPQEKKAVLTGSVEVLLSPVWIEKHQLVDGERIAAGTVHTKDGIARLVLDNGVVAVMESETDCTIQSNSRLDITKGRVTVKVPSSVIDFTLASPSALLATQGAEFGVSVPNSGDTKGVHTDVVVFDGSLLLSRNIPISQGTDSKIIGAGQKYTVSTDSVAIATNLSTTTGWVRDNEFVRRKSVVGYVKSLVANPDLLAYSYFDQDFDRFALEQSLPVGLNWKAAPGSSPSRLVGKSIASGNPDGQRLLVSNGQTAFLNLNTPVNSQLAEHGYIGSKPCIEQNGKTLFVSWKSKANKPSSSGYGGVSLVDGSEKRINEYLFLGQVAELSNFSCKVWADGSKSVDSPNGGDVYELNSDGSKPDSKPIPVDNRVHLWVLKIKFDPGEIQISVYLDPTVDEPPQPNLSVQTRDLQFNKMQLIAGANESWEYSRFLFGSSYEAVVPR